jgi:hypothetical protein
MCNKLNEKLINLGLSEDIVVSKILGLLFGFLKSKIVPNHDIYLYPYVKSAKGLPIIDELISKTHKNNFYNIMHVLQCYFDGTEPFP